MLVFGLASIKTHLFPGYADKFIHTPIWLQIVCFLIFDDLVQYWYHRLVHSSRWLWPLHLPHHSASYMGIRMVHRNGFFYVLLFPNVWLSGLLVYFGFGKVYVGYSVVKAIVTQLAHSELRWDAWLYQHMPRLAWLVERTISTPATHFAHHAASEGDGVGHHHGNYGNLLFFWDVLFGTALISRQYPQQFGLPPDSVQPQTWYQLMFYPLFKRR
jgi:sterol desaturase/sphingolipid hydroxylase (fatty acid hydroxylase superfamily)